MASADCVDELICETEGQSSSLRPQRIYLRLTGARFVSEDDVVSADACVEPALVVEVECLLGGDWWDFLVHIVECPVVAQSFNCVWETKEAPHSHPVQACTLGCRSIY
jgi:hypothetical protein